MISFEYYPHCNLLNINTHGNMVVCDRAYIPADDVQRSVLGYLDLLWSESMLLQLMGDQMAMSDLHFLFLGVPYSTQHSTDTYT